MISCLCFKRSNGPTISFQVIDTLISTSDGDLRRSITYLQSASRLSSSSDPPTPITVQDIQEIAGVVPSRVVSSFAAVLGIEPDNIDDDGMEVDNENPGQARLPRASGFDDVKNQVKLIMRQGYSGSQMLSQVRGEALFICCIENSRQLVIASRLDSSTCHPFSKAKGHRSADTRRSRQSTY